MLQSANADQPKGSFEGTRQSIAVDTNDQLTAAAQYAPLILHSDNGTVMRLSSIAGVIDNVENNRQGGDSHQGGSGDGDLRAKQRVE